MITKAVPARAGTRSFAVGIAYITEHAHKEALAAAGGAFKGGVAYATAPEKAAWVQLRGVTSVETAALEMDVVAMCSKCPEPVYHLIIAYAKSEHPMRKQVVSDAERMLGALGMEDHQYVISAHQDTDDFHAHVIANRVGPDWKANNLWRERIIRERLCAEIAAERGWDIVVGRHNRDIVQRVEQLHEKPEAPARRLDDGLYRRLHERGELPWQDHARSYVLDAVQRARSWEELHRRLDAHGVVVKLVQRGSRIQGLAFAEGLGDGAPGCAASRIDASCRLSALQERFGSFSPPTRERKGERKESMAEGQPKSALQQAERIVDHAKMGSEYQNYRGLFFETRGRAETDRYVKAWERERELRSREAEKRRTLRLFLRSIARMASRGALREVAYWTVDGVVRGWREREYAEARTRWERTKATLALERGRRRMEKAVTYREFIGVRARAGDACAQRVFDDLVPPVRDRQPVEKESIVKEHAVTLGDVQKRLDVIRAETEEYYKLASDKRDALERVERPERLDDVLDACRKKIREEVAEAADFSDGEKHALERMEQGKRSWNPFKRTEAIRAEKILRGIQEERHDVALRDGLKKFETHEVPRHAAIFSESEEKYRSYVQASLGFKNEMDDAWKILNADLPSVEKFFEVLKRCGELRISGIKEGECLSNINAAVNRAYESIPDEKRFDVERRMREERDMEHSMGMER